MTAANPISAPIHVKVLGGLCVAGSLIGIALPLFLLLVTAGIADGLARTVIFMVMGTSAISLMLGVGLLNGNPTARVIYIVMNFIGLLGIPFGTIFSAYALWVMMKHEPSMRYFGVETADDEPTVTFADPAAEGIGAMPPPPQAPPKAAKKAAVAEAEDEDPYSAMPWMRPPSDVENEAA